MKKLFLAILVILLAVIAIYFTINRKGKTPTNPGKLFALKSGKEIDRINISNSEGNVTLIKENDFWTVENKEVRHDLINSLLDAVSLVSDSQRDSVLQWLENGTKLTFYSSKSVVNSFYICKQNNSIYGVLYNSQNPYRLSLRGFPDIDLTKIYSANPEHWTLNLLLDCDPATIKSIVLEYPLKPEMGFQLEKLPDGQFYLSKNGQFKALTNTDPEILVEYLSFFNDIKYFHVSDIPQIEQEIINKQKPFFHFKLASINDTITEIWGYNKPNEENDDSDAYEFYATSKEKGIILLKYNDFDPIMVDIDYFLKK
jgi:hypothetical protein